MPSKIVIREEFRSEETILELGPADAPIRTKSTQSLWVIFTAFLAVPPHIGMITTSTPAGRALIG
jgi:hypothetical protein